MLINHACTNVSFCLTVCSFIFVFLLFGFFFLFIYPPFDIKNLSGKCYSLSHLAGLKMNVKKTKTIIISCDEENKRIEVEVNNEILQQVNGFIYLGTELREDINLTKR